MNQTLQANVYPNPSSDVVNIEFETPQTCTIELRSIDGRLIEQIAITQQSKISIDLSEVPSGIYLLTANSSTQNFTTKFVRE